MFLHIWHLLDSSVEEKKLRRLFYIYSLLLLPILAQAQVTTEGRDFWLGFMENSPGQGLALEIYLSARDTAQVNITAVVNNLNINVTVDPGVAQLVSIPLDFMPLEEGISNRGIHITSDEDISVYALNKRQFSADAAVILPTNALGKDYLVTAHMEPPEDIVNNSRESAMLIVAVEDDTEVEIVTSADSFRGLVAGDTTIVSLDAGQMYHIKSNEDLTGTSVRAVSTGNNDCKNIAVFGGNVFTNVGGCGPARDHLLEQMFPLSTWGENFLFVPYESRSGGDYIKIIAAEDDTEIQITGLDAITLDAGEVFINKALPDVRRVRATKPISFAQFSRSQDCDGSQGDPFYILVSPLEQRVRNVTFNAFEVEEINRYFLTLIAEAGSTANVELDGLNISDQFQTFEDGAYATLQISQGNHTVTAEDGVIAMVYGFGNVESFGYSAGIALENLNLQIQGDDEFIGNIIQNACLDAAIDFDASFETPTGEEPRFNTFEWDFGDGTTAEGQQLVHSYSVPGTYEITLVASDGQGSCGTSETVIRSIEVTDTQTNGIEGPASVCPDVVDVAYSISGEEGNSYEWFIEGGNITTSNTVDNVLVDWGSARDDAFIKVLPFNPLGCVGDTLTLPVIINKRLEPATPRSNGFTDNEVCFTDLDNVTYFTPPTNGSSYEWFIDTNKGEILGSNDSNEINVHWSAPGTGRVWYREFNPLISDCEGFSDTLQVTIYDEIISLPEIGNVLCNGEANGTISLDLTGGKPGDYQVSWDNGMEGTSISGLVAGDYVATITDALGCEIRETYTVTEPNELRIDDVGVLPVRCFQEANGSASLVVSGGTPDGQGQYNFLWEGENGNTQSSKNTIINTLPAGNYTVTVTDENGCQDQSNFTIDEPLLLEPDLESLINDPICPEASDGTAFIDAKGGTPDYQFFWDNNPTVDSRTATGLSKGTFTVRIVDANGCETFLDIDVTERFPKIFIPTAFSPNDDGVNDEFKPVADCAIVFSMQIVNRWGAIVFSTEDIDKGWNGDFENEKAPNGNYSYIIFYSSSINDIKFEETFRGSFKLIR